MVDFCPMANTSGYIKPDGQDAILFQFMPEDITDSKSANYTATEIIARSHPIQGYTNSGARVLSFTLKFYKTSVYDPLTYCRRLQALVYPDYSAGNTAPPAPCNVAIGAIAMRGICTQCDITYHHPWDQDEGLIRPMFAEVSLSFTEIGEKPWSFDDVIGFADMAIAL